MLRKKKEDKDVNLQLPPITFESVHIERELDFDFERSSFFQYVSPKDRRDQFFEQMEKDRDMVQTLLARREENHKDYSSLGLLQSVSASVSTFRRFLGVQKIKGAVELLREELRAKLYEKIVVFAIHRDVIYEMQELLRHEFRAVSLYGGTSDLTRERNLARFQNEKKCKILIANITSAGTAINLTHANQVLFVEMDWIPGNNAQAACRCHRIGQTRAVTVRHLVTDDQLDLRIQHILRRKMKELTQLFDEPVHELENQEELGSQIQNAILKRQLDTMCQ